MFSQGGYTNSYIGKSGYVVNRSEMKWYSSGIIVRSAKLQKFMTRWKSWK